MLALWSHSERSLRRYVQHYILMYLSGSSDVMSVYRNRSEEGAQRKSHDGWEADPLKENVLDADWTNVDLPNPEGYHIIQQVR